MLGAAVDLDRKGKEGFPKEMFELSSEQCRKRKELMVCWTHSGCSTHAEVLSGREGAEFRLK